MAFFIKNFESITASMLQSVSQSTTALTDFNTGSKIRTMLEAVAEEMEFLYHEMFRGILEGINTAVYNSFDFPLLPAVAASGVVTFSSVIAGTNTPLVPTSTFTIPAGFRVSIPSQLTPTISLNSAPAGTVYTVSQDTPWPAGQPSVNVTVSCFTAGSIGNTIANSITSTIDTLPPIQGNQYLVTNTIPFTNGQNVENQTDRQIRFARYLQSLSRGTLDAIEYAALTATVTNSLGAITEQVKKVYAVEPYMIDGSKPTCHVNVYVYNGVGGTSAALVSSAQQIIDGYTDSNNNRIPGYKAAGVVALVYAATEIPQSININIVWQSGFSLNPTTQNQIEQSIVNYFNSLSPGDTLVYNQLIEIVMAQTGVYNCLITSPNGDVVTPNQQSVMTLSSINITSNATPSLVTGETFG